MPNEWVKYYFWGHLWKRQAFDSVDQVNRSTLTNVGRCHPVHWGSKYLVFFSCPQTSELQVPKLLDSDWIRTPTFWFSSLQGQNGGFHCFHNLVSQFLQFFYLYVYNCIYISLYLSLYLNWYLSISITHWFCFSSDKYRNSIAIRKKPTEIADN